MIKQRNPRGTTSRAVLFAAVAIVVLCLGAASSAEEHVVFERDGARVHVSGEVVVEAQDGGVLLLDHSGKLHTAQPDEIIKRTSDDVPFQPWDSDILSGALLKELPDGFEVHKTAHYLICYNTSTGYAQWCGALFERLYRAFTNFWTRRGLEIDDPEMPLIAIVFADQESYQRYARIELGDAVKSIIGYYNLMTNRVVMYDLTGAQAVRQPGDHRRTRSEINRVLSRPEAGSLVATIIHEATHQIAFNCGLQTRLADIPIWLSEGIAMYFETPDLGNSQGWRGIGSVNRNRLIQFRAYARKRPEDSLATLMSSDRRIQGRSDEKRFQGQEAILNAYAEAWCMTYFLIQQHPKEFSVYLKRLSEKPPLLENSAEERLDEFTEIFGDLDSLDVEFLRQVSRIR